MFALEREAQKRCCLGYDKIHSFVKIKNNIREHYDFKLLAEEISLKGVFVKNMLSKIECAESNQKLLIDALYLGLSAFDSEVKFDED